MITDVMVNAAARAMFAKTKASLLTSWESLPDMVQFELKELALAALSAAEPCRPKPES